MPSTTGLLTRYEDEAIPPSSELSSDYRLQWCKTAMLEGEQYLRNQPLYEKQAEVREYLLGFKNTLRGALGLSDIQVSEVWAIYQTLAGDWTDVNPFWNYSSENPADQKSARNLSKLAKINYIRSGSDGQVNMMARQSLESASGVMGIEWNRQKQDLYLRSWQPDDVLPERPNDPDSYQGCLAVGSRRETTVNFAKAMFPHMKDYITMDRDAALTGLGMRHREMLRNRIAGSVSAFEIVDVMDALPTQRLGAMPVVDLFYMYIDDQSVNERSEPIMMGDWDRDRNDRPFARNFWSYIVPPGGKKYPIKRLIIYTRKCVLYDGPSPYWHGMFPFVKFTPDPFPGLWYGISPLFPIMSMQYSLDKIYRAYDDHIQKILRPPVYGDKNSISQPELDKIDPRQQGQRWRQNPHGKGVQVAQIPNLDPMIETHKLDLRDRMWTLSGAKAVNAAMDIAQAGQIPEGETVEKLMKFMGTINNARSRQLERAQCEVGQMQAYNFMEYYDVRRTFFALGQDGVEIEKIDYDPYSIIPYYEDGSYTDASKGKPGHDAKGRVIDMRPRMDRAIDAGARISLLVKPGYLMNSASQNRKMMVMMLRSKGDFPLYATLKELGFEDIGPEPPGSLFDQIMAEKQLVAQAEMGQPQFTGPSGPGAPGGGGGDQGGPGGGGSQTPPGRPNTFQQDPHMEGSNSNAPKIATS